MNAIPIRSCYSLIILLWMMPALHAQKGGDKGFTSAQKDSVKELIKPLPHGVQFAVGLIDSGKTRFYGLKRTKEGFERVSNEDSIFRIGSLTKVFTATLLAEFVHRDKLGSEDTIWGAIGLEPKLDTGITFQHLATHTSGLPRVPAGLMFSSGFDLKDPYKGYDRKKLEKYVRERMRLMSAPGEKYAYSNLGYGLLGYGLSKISGSSYEELIQKHIAGPYKMDRTSTSLERFREKAIKGLNKKGKPTPYWELRSMKGAGALFSTVEDLSRFVRANFDPSNKVLQLQQKVLHPVNEGMDMALGWHVLKQDNGERWHWHNGGTGGFRSSLVMNVDRKEAVIVLSNVSAGHKRSGNIDRLSFLLLRSL